MPRNHLEGVQILRYEPGQSYQQHYDYFNLTDYAGGTMYEVAPGLKIAILDRNWNRRKPQIITVSQPFPSFACIFCEQKRLCESQNLSLDHREAHARRADEPPRDRARAALARGRADELPARHGLLREGLPGLQIRGSTFQSSNSNSRELELTKQ